MASNFCPFQFSAPSNNLIGESPCNISDLNHRPLFYEMMKLLAMPFLNLNFHCFSLTNFRKVYEFHDSMSNNFFKNFWRSQRNFFLNIFNFLKNLCNFSQDTWLSVLLRSFSPLVCSLVRPDPKTHFLAQTPQFRNIRLVWMGHGHPCFARNYYQRRKCS